MVKVFVFRLQVYVGTIFIDYCSLIVLIRQVGVSLFSDKLCTGSYGLEKCEKVSKISVFGSSSSVGKVDVVLVKEDMVGLFR